MRPNTVNGMYDYRFGWRWLLPFEPGPDIYLAGFDENERAFWSEALATDARVDTAGPAKGWIINAGPASAQPPVIPAMDASTQWVAVVASDKCMGQWRRNIADNFSSIREYAMLPAFNPRVVIPLGSPRHTYYALNLHRPGRPAARAGLKAAQLLALMGNYAFLKKRLLIATRNPSACPAGAMQSDILGHVSGTPLDYALYLGTPGENRKTTVLPLNSKKPHTILKIAATQQARSSLMNEAAALKELRTTPCPDNRAGQKRAAPQKRSAWSRRCSSSWSTRTSRRDRRSPRRRPR